MMWQRFVTGGALVGAFLGCAVPYGEPAPPQASTTATDVTQPRRDGGDAAPLVNAGDASTLDGVAADGRGAAAGADGGTDAGADAEAIDAGRACPTATAIDATKLPWKPPATMVGACTQGDLTAFVTYLSTTKATSLAVWKVEGVASATCRACMFGSNDAVAWAPIVELPGGEDGFVNVGGCIGIASGSTVCGKAYQNWSDCRFEACKDCSADEAGTCLTAVNAGACQKATKDVIDICGAALAPAETRCQAMTYNFEGPVKAQCIGGI